MLIRLSLNTKTTCTFLTAHASLTDTGPSHEHRKHMLSNTIYTISYFSCSCYGSANKSLTWVLFNKKTPFSASPLDLHTEQFLHRGEQKNPVSWSLKYRNTCREKPTWPTCRSISQSIFSAHSSRKTVLSFSKSFNLSPPPSSKRRRLICAYNCWIHSLLMLQRLSLEIKCNLGWLWQLSNLLWHIRASETQTPKVYIRELQHVANNSKPTIDHSIDCRWGNQEGRSTRRDRISFPLLIANVVAAKLRSSRAEAIGGLCCS